MTRARNGSTGLQAILVRETPKAWIVKVVGSTGRGWSGAIPKSQSTWLGGRPPKGTERTIYVEDWWVRRRLNPTKGNAVKYKVKKRNPFVRREVPDYVFDDLRRYGDWTLTVEQDPATGWYTAEATTRHPDYPSGRVAPESNVIYVSAPTRDKALFVAKVEADAWDALNAMGFAPHSAADLEGNHFYRMWQEAKETVNDLAEAGGPIDRSRVARELQVRQGDAQGRFVDSYAWFDDQPIEYRLKLIERAIEVMQAAGLTQSTANNPARGQSAHRKTDSGRMGAKSMAKRNKRTARKRKNPQRETHRKEAQQELKAAKAAIEEAESAQMRDRPVDTAILAVEGLTSATLAFCEAKAAESDKLTTDARLAMRRSGEALSWAIDTLQQAGVDASVAINPWHGTRRNQRGRQPGVTPSMLIRLYSSSLLTGTNEIYLVVNTDGEVMDAILTPQENFAPVADAGYAGLPILELDITGPQYRKLVQLARRLAEVEAFRPVFRPGRGGIRPSQEQRLADERRKGSRPSAQERRTGTQTIGGGARTTTGTQAKQAARPGRAGPVRDALSDLTGMARAANPSEDMAKLKRRLMGGKK